MTQTLSTPDTTINLYEVTAGTELEIVSAGEVMQFVLTPDETAQLISKLALSLVK